MPPHKTSAPTSTLTMVSASGWPAIMAMAATMAPTEPRASAAMCSSAPRRFSSPAPPLARISATTLPRLIASPIAPTTSTAVPGIAWAGLRRRSTTSTPIQPAATTNNSPLENAPRASARTSPNVRCSVQGWAASRAAPRARMRLATSPSMCTASESRASDPVHHPATASTTRKPPLRISDHRNAVRARWSRSSLRPWLDKVATCSSLWMRWWWL